MRLVVTDSAGAVMAPKSIEASSESHHRASGIPRNVTGMGSPTDTMLVSPPSGSEGTAPRLTKADAGVTGLASRSKSVQPKSPASSSLAASTVSASGPGAATLKAYSIRSGIQVSRYPSSWPEAASYHASHSCAALVTAAGLAPPGTGGGGSEAGAGGG